MFKPGVVLMLGLLLALPATAAEPTADAQAGQKTTKQLLAEFRDEIQAIETEVVSKSISLSADEATRFWPLFKKFQSEKAAIIDDQVAAVRTYANEYADLNDEESMAYVQSLLDRDERINKLRRKYLAEFAGVIAPGKAARVIHISRRLGLAGQARLASAIPLVH
jgi:aspartyl aminopeptidase